MSIQLISRYYAEVDKIIHYGGSRKETSIRNAFQHLLNEYARQKDLLLIPELDFKTPAGKTVFPDGTLKDALRLDWGYWESKDTDDDLTAEIEKKFEKGYPNSNILFEDSHTAVLYQQGAEVRRCLVREPEKLDKLLHEFVNYTRPEVRNFRQALEKFKEDLPTVANALREMITKQSSENQEFIKAQKTFLELCKESINAEITIGDVNEMLIQHILTEEIFTSVFDDPQFHQENNISKELQKLERTFFTGTVKRNTLDGIKPYYLIIKAQAAGIANHTEKQKFLKIIYENFYKAYNPKGADRLGIVYTPDELVKFMLNSTDTLLFRHFNKILASENVEILDPATGTGTFICDLIEHLPKDKLAHKFKHEIHCNEVAILPYYIANLNIEATFKQKMGYYEEFKNICFVDTLDNLGFDFTGKTAGLNFGFSAENMERIKRQNEKKISVIIGNPPYNANQQNENDNNKNREYFADRKKKIGGVDGRIKATYIANSTAQKTKLYDMYSRFFRWASDRLTTDKGIIAFVTNRSFIDSRTFDGFRKCIQDEFQFCYIIDTKSDVRANPKISGTKNNIFGIQTGVAVMFLVKDARMKGKCRIEYVTMPDEWTKTEKLNWLAENPIDRMPFDLIQPDPKHNWLNITDNDFESLLPVADKKVKNNKNNTELDQALFKLFSTGISTNRDEWILDFAEENLKNKMTFFSNFYNSLSKENEDFETSIKWSRNLKQRFKRGNKENYTDSRITKFNYRPYIPIFLYHSEIFIDEHGVTNQISGEGNKIICISGNGSSKPFQVLSVIKIFSLDFLEKTQCLPLYRYDEAGNRIDNITDWGVEQFCKHYGFSPSPSEKAALRLQIFYYTYAVLHHPAYRKKYEQNLKREFPRLPFYEDFGQWAAWGKQLMDLHLYYETAEPFPLERTEPRKTEKIQQALFAETFGMPLPENTSSVSKTPKSRLKADKEAGIIEIDDQTTLKGIPAEAWAYKLGNRSALEWILDQYKESKPSDPTIAEKFNTYRFADYKEQVIDLLLRVCTVSVATMKIIRAMEEKEI